MNTNKIIIAEPEFVIKSYNRKDTKGVMKSRYASGIIFVLRGQLEFVFASHSVLLGECDAVYIPEGASYSYVCRDEAESLVINFHTVEQTTKAIKLNRLDKKIAEGIFEELKALLPATEESFHAILAIYHRLLAAFSAQKKPMSAAEAYVKRAEAVILEHFSTPKLTCADIAQTLSISAVYLRKLFMKQRSMPVSKYLLKTRMEHAHHLLLEGCSVSATAARAGYCELYQFSRAYKKYFGFSPSKTR